MTTLFLFGDIESSSALRHEIALAVGDALRYAVRFEDQLLVADHGRETLTNFPYSLTPGR